MKIEASIAIDAPPESVWPIATDPRLVSRWNSNIVRVEYDGEGAVETGTRWTQVVSILGSEETMEAEVVECHPPFRGVVRMRGRGEPLVTTTVHPEGNGSILTQVIEISIPAGLVGVALRLGEPVIRAQLNEALRRQKEAAEGGG